MNPCESTPSPRPGGHPINEDALRVEPHPLDPGVLLVALADGQGGRAGGARAAELAVDTAIRLAGLLEPNRLDYHAWPRLLSDADASVAGDPASGFTTLLALAVYPDGNLGGAASGDSSLLVLGDGYIDQPTAFQKKNPPVGSGGAVFTHFADELDAPWQLVAMTDGVWKYAGWPAVKQLAGELRGQSLIEALAARARLPGSGTFPDDFTVAVISSHE